MPQAYSLWRPHQLDGSSAKVHSLIKSSFLSELRAGPTGAQTVAANSGIGVAASQREAAQAQLDLLVADVRPEQLALYEIGVQEAEAAVTQAAAAVSQAEAAVQQAQAGVAQAGAGREAAKLALERMTLKAPFTGIVAGINVEQGEIVAPGLPVVQLADFSSWLVETTDLTELDIVAVVIGQQVEARLVAVPVQALKGEVIGIASLSELTRGDVTYRVTIALTETRGLPLRWGMTAFVDIDVES